MKAALINSNNTVENIVVWDETYIIPEGFSISLLEDDASVGVGYLVDNQGNFINPIQPTDDELWEEIRRRRNFLLTDSDWIVAKSIESNVPVPELWITYRQSLRDIPTVYQDPRDVQWPSKPGM